MTQTIDLKALIDDAPLRPIHLVIFLICFATSVVDGLDTQMIGISAPAMAEALHLSVVALGTVFSAGPAGALLGALISGVVADRVGRKISLVLFTALFAVLTGTTVFARGVTDLVVLRILAGIGLGGALPAIFTLVSEYAPRRRRGLAVGLLWTGYPIGGMIGGALGSYLIPAFGWHAMFVLGGALGAVVVAMQVLGLSESIDFLAVRTKHEARIRTIVRKLNPNLAPDATFTFSRAGEPARALVRELFAHGRGTITFLVWTPLLCTLLLSSFFVLWGPVLLRQAGYGLSMTAGVLALNNLASVPSQAASGYLIDRRGPFQLVIVSYLVLMLGTVGVGIMLHVGWAVVALMTLNGFLIGPGIAGIVYIATRAYPAEIRATGVGWALGVSRGGQILGSLVTGAELAAGVPIAWIFAGMSLPALVALLSAIALRRKVYARPSEFAELQLRRDTHAISPSAAPAGAPGLPAG